MKNQIWSPEQTEALGGFQAFQLPNSSSEGERGSFSPKKIEEKREFSNDFPDYAQLLLEDPDVRNRLENRVKEKVSRELIRLITQLQEIDGFESIGENIGSDLDLEVMVQKCRENLVTKFQSHYASIQAQERMWNQMIADFERSRNALMRSHEKAWCEAMGHLLRQFQIANSSGIIAALEEWLATSVPDFLEKSPVVVHLSKKDFDAVKGSQQELKGLHWSMQPDLDLVPGQIRIESGNAGVIFDSIRGFEKLNRFLECES